MTERIEYWRNTIDLAELLLGLGEDLEREGLLETPERVHSAWLEFLEGYTLSPEQILGRTFTAESAGIQASQSIEFTSMCEHHLLPFFGICDIAYRPGVCVAGLSKLARLVDCFARRLQIQERMTQQIADALNEALQPQSVLVIVRAKHLCCHGRGINRKQMLFTTSAEHGCDIAALWRILGR